MLSVITLTTAVSGSGKTYVRCPVFLIKDFLPERPGVHWSNFPVFADKVVDEVARRTGRPVTDFEGRVKIIPPEIIASWKRGSSGPWDFFDNIDLQDSHIAIDEVHNFCGRKSLPAVKAKWQAWLGEIRHRGATVELISQHFKKIATELVDEAGTRLQLVSTESRRDPVFAISLKDWYELRAKFLTGTYDAKCFQIEKREVDGKWVNADTKLFALDTFFFQFYDSYSTPHSGGVKGTGVVREFQRRGRIGLLWWFFKRNAFRIFVRLAVASGIMFMLSGGGGPLITWFISGVVAAGSPHHVGSTPPVVQASSTVVDAVARPRSSDIRSFAPTPIPPRRAPVAFHASATTTASDPYGDWIVAGLISNRVLFSNGETCRVGERLRDGPKKGRLLLAIDYENCEARLSGGDVLVLGH